MLMILRYTLHYILRFVLCRISYDSNHVVFTYTHRKGIYDNMYNYAAHTYVLCWQVTLTEWYYTYTILSVGGIVPICIVRWLVSGKGVFSVCKLTHNPQCVYHISYVCVHRYTHLRRTCYILCMQYCATTSDRIHRILIYEYLCNPVYV